MKHFLNLHRRKIVKTCLIIAALFIIGVMFVDINPQDNDWDTDGRISATATEEPNLPPPENPVQRQFELSRNMSPSGTFYPLRDDDTRIVYLTFDDGPSYNVTPEILRILRENGIRATFFVLGTEVEAFPEIVRQIVEEGHTLANHSFSHVYRDIYASADSLLAEIQQAEDAINAALGFEYNNRIFRFPGGSHGRSLELRNAVLDAGFQYVDWNVVSNDSVTARSISADLIFRNTVTSTEMANRAGQYQLTVLFHDNNTKMTTAEALPRIIEFFREDGYEFRTLDEM